MTSAITTPLDAALTYLRAGLSVIPIRRDGSKAPDGKLLPIVWSEEDARGVASWKPFTERLPTEAEVRAWFDRADPPGIGVVSGKVSGNLETIDFDREAEVLFPAWQELVEEEAPGLVEKLSVVRTPRRPAGYHVRYRCPEVVIPGNQPLAVDPSKKGKERTLIETRGEGGYALAPGSPEECHDSHAAYAHHAGPRLSQVQAVAPELRECLLRCTRYFSREAKQEAPPPGPGLKPGEDFDARGPDWQEILGPHGWECTGRRGDERRWRRPGKDGRTWSATTGHCRGKDGADLLRVFSSSAHPFEDGKAYGKFRAWSLLNHEGDWSAAAKALAAQGFGTKGASNGTAAQPQQKAAAEPVSDQEVLPVPWPDPPAREAFHGLAGEVVDAIDPETEADRVAILAQFLAFFGNAAGRHVYRTVGVKRHHPNLFVVLVGRTAKGRKGTSLAWVESLFEAADPVWAKECIQTGLSSGEGLIHAVRDESRKRRPGAAPGDEEEVTDPGARDKRLLTIEEEFASVMRLAARDGNILSTVLRRAFDGVRLQTLTKNSPLRATGGHISCVGHITREELVHCLTENDQRNGWANRFLWLAVKRSKLLPDGGRMLDLSPLHGRIREALRFASADVRMDRTLLAKDIWHQAYRSLAMELPGALGLVTSRGEAIVLRLALTYALLDRAPEIDACHLEAALALWDYSVRSCRWVFGDSTGCADTDILLATIRAKGEAGMTTTDISGLFNRHKSAAELRRILGRLVELGLVEAQEERTGGRPRIVWKSTECEKGENGETTDGTRTCDDN
jgi:hypothetical protein